MEENLQQPQWKIILKKVWPTIYRVINSVFYFLINVIKNFFKVAMDEFKGK